MTLTPTELETSLKQCDSTPSSAFDFGGDRTFGVAWCTIFAMRRGATVWVTAAALLLSGVWASPYTVQYTVQSGDTIYSLAKRFGTTAEALLKLNHLSAPDLKVGQTITVPDRTYTVQKGDTLFSIAKRYGVSLEALRQTNNLTDNAVRLGQTLVIPWPENAAVSSSPPVTPAPTKPVAANPTTPETSKPPAPVKPPVSSQPKPPVPKPTVPKPSAPQPPAPSSPTVATPVGKPPVQPVAPTAPTLTKPAPALSQPAAKPVNPDALDPNDLPPLPSGLPGMTAPTRPAKDLPVGSGSAKPSPWPLISGAALPNLGGSTGGTSSVPTDNPLLIHTVQPGETLFGLARRYNVTVEAIKTQNQLLSDGISAGQQLQIPVAPTDPSLPSSPRDLRGIAERYLGVTYVYGGSSATGLDCSGFVGLVFQELGVKLPRTSREQFQSGTSVEKSDLTPGDLVFFNTTGAGVSHVGIFLGDGSFIHAASNPGKVIESRLDERYYAQRYLGARRVLPQDD